MIEMEQDALEREIMEGEPDRSTYLGSSDAAGVLGVGAYGNTPLSVYMKKIGQREEMDASRKLWLERRKRWEPVVVQMLREEMDAEIVSVNTRYKDKEHSFLAAEIDFEWRDPSDGSIQNGEIKTVHPLAFGESHGWGDAGTDEIPVHYSAQTMFGLMVTGRRVCIPAVMLGIDNVIFYRVERDDEMIADMRAECVKFWTEHVLLRNPPPASSTDDLKRYYTKVNGRPVQLTSSLEANLNAMREIRESIKAMEGDLNEVQFKIGAEIVQSWGLAAGTDSIDNAVIERDGATVATWKRQRGAHLDQKRLKLEKPEVVSAYTVDHFFRACRILKAF